MVEGNQLARHEIPFCGFNAGQRRRRRSNHRQGGYGVLCDLEFDAPERHRQAWELFQFYPVIIHELRHVWQMRTWGWRYIVCCLPVLRNFTIEKDAYRIQDAAEKFFMELDGVRCAAQFQERMKKMENHDV